MKKILALLLSVIMLCAVFTACAGNDDDGKGTGNTGTTGASGDETVGDYECDLPELDFKDETITIMHRASGDFAREFECDASATDIVDQAVYTRNRKVESQLHVKLNYVGNTSTDWLTGYSSFITEDIMTGDYVYDIFSGPSYHIMSPMLEGCYANLETTEYLDLDKGYWANGLNDGMAIEGKVYLVTGDISLGLVKYLHCLIFNKTFFADYYNDEDIYKVVEDGEWTLEKMAEYTAGVYKDLDLDDTKTEGDQYGYVISNTNLLRAYIDALNANVVRVDENGEAVVWDDNQEHVMDVVSTMYEYVNGPDVYYTKDETNEKSYKMFREGRTLFVLGRLTDLSSTYRDISSFKYGVLPLPKWSEDMEYAVTICGSESTFAISSGKQGDERDRASAVLEALCAESYKSVTPVYYTDALKIKYDMANEDARMLDIIHDGATFNPNVQLNKIINNNDLSKAQQCLDYCFSYAVLHEANWMSNYDANKDFWTYRLEEIRDAISKLDDN